MKFERLQASIANNGREEPNLYMALCMVESLFMDVEDSCGGEDICDCPGGDELLSVKLVWLCQTINEIYHSHDEELQRNRSRLDAAMEKLKNTQEKLEDAADAAMRLDELKEEYEGLQKKLQDRNAVARQCEALNGQCDQVRRKLEELEGFDVAAAELELEKLARRVSDGQARKADMAARLEAARQENNRLEQDLARAQAEAQSVRNRADSLNETLTQTRTEKLRLMEEYHRLEDAQSAADQEKQKLLRVTRETEIKLKYLQDKISESRNGELGEKLAELERLRKELNELVENRNSLVAEGESLENQRNQLIIDIANSQRENETCCEKLLTSQKKLEQLRQEKLRLNGSLSGYVQELETLQSESEQLKQRKIPEARELLMQEKKRWNELVQSMEQHKADRDRFKDDIAKLNERLPKMEKAVSDERVIYDALTARYTASSKELESLERQNAELRSKNDEEKLAVYRNQLEQTRRQLEQIRRECDQLEQENIRGRKALEDGQNERARLLELKQRHESGREVTAKQLKELAFAGTESFAREVAALEERVKLLERVREKLAASIAGMRQLLGHAPLEESIPPEKQMRHELREMQQRLEDLRCALVECANSVKMEVR